MNIKYREAHILEQMFPSHVNQVRLRRHLQVLVKPILDSLRLLECFHRYFCTLSVCGILAEVQAPVPDQHAPTIQRPNRLIGLIIILLRHALLVRIKELVLNEETKDANES
jgi:hypothetical protein